MSDITTDAPASPRPFQFTLKMLLAFTAFVALTCLIAVEMGLFGLSFYALIIGVWLAYGFERYRYVGLALMCMSLLGLMFAQPKYSSGPARKAVCMNNLHNLSVALREFYERQHHFPRANELGRDGVTVHSWRVAILTNIEEYALSNTYRTDEPWNGDNNKQLKKYAIPLYRCPNDHDAPDWMTNYVAVVGPHTAWSPDRALTKDDFPDGLENTIFLVEIPNSGIHWMEPRDITVEQFRTWFAKLKDEPRLAPHDGGVNVLMGDGRVIRLPTDLSLETLDALLTRDGGEKVDLDDLH